MSAPQNDYNVESTASNCNLKIEAGCKSTISFTSDKWHPMKDSAVVALRILALCVNVPGKVKHIDGTPTVTVSLQAHETLSVRGQEIYLLVATDENGKPTMLARGGIAFV